MFSWLSVALGILPEIAKALFGDKYGGVAESVSKAVKDATNAKTPEEAKEKLKANPEMSDELRIKLAQIAAEAEEKKREHELATLKEQLAAQDKERQAELSRLQAAVEDVKGARGTFQALAESGSRFAWGAPIVSLVVTVGFFVILGMLLYSDLPDRQTDRLQVLNVILGTLATAFTTVVTFWVGSAQSSRNKDEATFRLLSQQSLQSAQATERAIEIVKEAPKGGGAAAAPVVATKSKDAFDRCLDVILKWEGGEKYTNHPRDRGGPTKFGITLKTLKDWFPDKDITATDVKNLDRETACEIFRTNYWNKLKCDELPAGVDLVVFDFGVTSGIGRSAKMLQDVVGAKEDGSIGPATIGATKSQDPLRVIESMSEKRRNFYAGLADADVFGKGWANRTNDVEQNALAMARAVPAPLAA